MSRIGRRDTALATVVDIVLAHIYGPSTDRFVEDFRHLGRGEWDVPVGDERVTKNGDPQPGEPLGESDIKSADFVDTTTGRYVDAGDAFDLGPNDDLSTITLYQTGGAFTGRPGLIVKGDANFNAGWRVRLRDNGNPRIQVYDGTDVVVQGAGTNEGVDGSPHTFIGAVDRGGATSKAIHDGGQFVGSSDISAIGDCSNSGVLHFGTDISTEPPSFPDLIGLEAVVRDWISEPVAAFLHELLVGGDVAPGTIKRIESWLSGNRETGWSRKPLPYLARYGLWGDAYFTFDSNRLVHGADGVGLAQLNSQSGTRKRKYTQRTKSNRPIVRRTKSTGAPADHLEFTGGEKLTRSESTTIDRFSFYGAIKNTASDNTGTDTIALWDSGSSAFLVLYYDGNGDFVLRAEDDNGNSFLETLSGIDYSKWTAFVATIDLSSATYRLVAEDASGTSASISSTSSGTNTSVASSTEVVGGPSGSGAWTFGSEMTADLSNLHAVPIHLSSSDQDALLADLATRLPQ